MSLNLLQCLSDSEINHPNCTATIMDESKLTYAQLGASARKVANILREKGIGPGAKVGLMAPNTPHFSIVYFGILYTGATVVPINSLFKSKEIEHYLKDSGSEILFVWQGFIAEAAQAFKSVECCRNLIVVGGQADEAEDFQELFDAASPSFDAAQTMPDDTAVILYTSGTTGSPKGAELSHFNLFSNARTCQQQILHLTPDDVGLAVLPLFHSFGQTVIQNACLMGGAAITMIPAFDPKRVLEIIERDKVTFISAVPAMYNFIVAAAKSHPEAFASVRLAVSGGSALPNEVHAQFRQTFGFDVIEGYGLSETSPVASFNWKGVKAGSIGHPIPGCQMKIGKEDGQDAQAGEVGEVLIRGHNIMKGYYNKPEATAAVMKDGWFHTGDIGKMDEDGFFYIVDRKKDLIIRGGMNIYPREIEEVLFEHPGILEAAVIGIPLKKNEEKVVACVVPTQDLEEPLDQAQIKKYCSERMADYKVPKKIQIMDALPKNATGKVLKRKLKEQITNPPNTQ